MKGKIIGLIVLMVFGVIGIMGVVSALENCSDTDGGKNYYQKGNILESNFEDRCEPSGLLKEYYCQESGEEGFERYNCSRGCLDGACLKESSEKIQTCNETDGGNNAYEKGHMVAWIFSSNGNLEKVETTDSCVGDGTVENTNVIEYYCINDGQNYNSISIRCPNGCSDGACLREPSNSISIPQTNKCFETDGGIVLYAKYFKGSTTGPWLMDINGPVYSKEDFCSETNSNLQEYTCEQVSLGSNVYGMVQKGVDCPWGCKNGACIPLSCNDSDNGDKFYVKGFVRVIAEELDDIDEDTCINDNDLAEQSCVDGQQKTILYECAGGCVNGACKKIELTPGEDDVPLKIPEDKIKEKNEETGEEIEREVESVFICNGCELDKKCYPFGFRKDGNFCSDKDSKFIIQNKQDSSCENNFECDSNLCINSKCVSGSLWAKIMRWFSRLFGGE